jgi:hypothetical protein
MITRGIHQPRHPNTPNSSTNRSRKRLRHASKDNDFRTPLTTMRFDLIWYLPLCLLVLFYIIIPNAIAGYQNIRMELHRFTWAILFSPSAYIFLPALFASILAPIGLLNLIPTLFSRDADNQVYVFKGRYLWALLVALSIYVSAILIQFLIWGSLPLEVDRNREIHIRMIPFYPWPGTF